MKSTARYHGTITAINVMKSGHMILQLDRTKEVVVTGFSEAAKSTTLRPFDNILYEETPAPTPRTYKGQTIMLKKPGITVISIQIGDPSLNRLRRERKPRGEISMTPTVKPSAQEQADITAGRFK